MDLRLRDIFEAQGLDAATAETQERKCAQFFIALLGSPDVQEKTPELEKAS